MNTGFKQVDKRFEQVDKRFEEMRNDMNARFEQQLKYIGWMIAGMFTMSGAFIVLLIWDRRTMINEAKRQIYEEMDSEAKPEKLKRVLKSFRELAKVDERVAEILKKEKLL
jgi:tetrahydromethanopterin S-methyltransferase subunit G